MARQASRWRSVKRREKRPREALLDAAVAEFTSKGYEAATVAGIAARAGVTTGAVYGHFRSKLELLLEAVGLSHGRDVHAPRLRDRRQARVRGRARAGARPASARRADAATCC